MLQDSWGTVSVQRIADNLHRSFRAVRNMALRLGLGPAYSAGDFISYAQLLEGLGYNKAGTTMVRLKRLGLPVIKKTLVTKEHYVINLSAFWKWAEQNRAVIDFSKMEPLVFGWEPDWVAEARKVNRERPKKRLRRWTDTEDRELVWGMEHGKSYADLAKQFDRTECAIRSRLYSVGRGDLATRSDWREWTEQEVETMKAAILRGESYDQIGARLDRPASAVKGYLYRVYGTCHTIKVYRLFRKAV